MLFSKNLKYFTLVSFSLLLMACGGGSSSIAEIETDTTEIETNTTVTTEIETNTTVTAEIETNTTVTAETETNTTVTAEIVTNTIVPTQTTTVTTVTVIPAKYLATGQTKSYDSSSQIVSDGSQRDDGYYKKGLTKSYTRDDAKEVVIDNITGLMWQDNLETATVEKQWLTTANNTLCQADKTLPVCLDTSGDTSTTYCEDLVIDSYTDWRLPTIEELQTLINYPSTTPGVDPVFQNNNTANQYDTSSTPIGFKGNRWVIYFPYSTQIFGVNKGLARTVRCVRQNLNSIFVDNNFSKLGDIVRDNITQLEWQDNNESNSTQVDWQGAIDYCEALSLGEKTDWRLPNMNELFTIADRNNTIDSAFAPVFEYTTSLNPYWSSTHMPKFNWARTVNFNYAASSGTSRSFPSGYVRCVRNKLEGESSSTPETTTVSAKYLATSQTKSYDSDSEVVTDGTQRDDGYYKKGLTKSYTRDDDKEVVVDNITGLMWQDNAEASTVTKQWLTTANYTLCQSDMSSPSCLDTLGDTSTSYCENLVIDSYTDWRLPTIEELQTLIKYTSPAPLIDQVFQNINTSTRYDTSSTSNNLKRDRWTIAFRNTGVIFPFIKSDAQAVRCVRNNLNSIFVDKSFSKSGDIVSDNITQLEWQDNNESNSTLHTWQGAIDYCEALSLSEKTGWRLPNVNELLTIVDRNSINPAINNEFNYTFIGSTFSYWSSTDMTDFSVARTVNFRGGYTNSENRNAAEYVRCVRDK